MDNLMCATILKFDITLINNVSSPLLISKDDVVSISIQQDFNNNIFPMFRIRLYTDITTLTYINENPKNLDMTISATRDICEINQEDKTFGRTLETSAFGIYQNKKLRCYIESKNTPYSEYDNYQQGIKKDDSLNTTSKVPITLYCYDEEAIRNIKRKVTSIFKNTTLMEVINYMANECDLKCTAASLDNNEKFDQILIPNLSFVDAISYLDSYYGLYKSGAMLTTDAGSGHMMLGPLSRDVQLIHNNTINIRVTSYKAGNTFSGLYYNSNLTGELSCTAITTDTAVSIKSATDIEQTVNPKIFSAINVEDFGVESSELKETFKRSYSSNITAPSLIHKTKNNFLTSMYKTLVEEKNTQIDVSMDLAYIRPVLYHAFNRFTFTFDNLPRGIDIDRVYRPMQVTDVFTNIGSGKFTGKTTISLC